jgi:hypothetical protein
MGALSAGGVGGLARLLKNRFYVGVITSSFSAAA